jgi:16S rRNA (guanine966-N2)-methyltransferase
MNIIGGEKRGARLASLQGRDTRPTAQRTREALFNLLEGGRFGRHLLSEHTVIWDVFAGTGAIGLEALSRGAGHAVFIEKDRLACQTLTANIRNLGYQARVTLHHLDATQPFTSQAASASIIICDPPYGSGAYIPALAALNAQNKIGRDALIIIETQKTEMPAPDDSYQFLDSRHYGKARISLFRYTG